jgi:diguanylate cyclase (GGDEF)-like protein/PAS domain S-box-containing protein
MSGASDPSADALARRLRRERAARREAEIIAEESTRRLYESIHELTAVKAALDETTDFVAISDVDGHPVYMNRALEELLGVHARDIGDVNVLDLLTPLSRTRYSQEAIPTLDSKGVWRGEFAWQRPDGGEIAVSQVLIAHRSVLGDIERVSSISRDVTEQRALQEHLAEQALHDPLTGLANRRLLFDRLDLAQARSSRSGSALGIVFMDLDDFKTVNDVHGHDAGDEVLIKVSARLRSSVRGTDTLARFGGDEFMVICEDVAGPRDITEVAVRLGAAVSVPMEVRDTTLSLTMSIGLAFARDARIDINELLRRADSAMYRAKSAGKGRWELVEVNGPSRDG